MVGKSVSHTKADKRRFRELQEVGCIACWQRGIRRDVDVHHLLSGGYRMGHQYTLGLCPYHHRGVLPENMDPYTARELLGPSLSEEGKAFHDEFGTDNELYALQARLLEAHRATTRI